MPQGPEEQPVAPSEGAEALETGDSTLSADAVVDFLMANPDFFSSHGDVLSFLDMPDRFGHPGRNSRGQQGAQVVDFQKAILAQQREAVEELRECVRDVIETSRSNMSVQQRTHAAVLALLGAQDFDALVRVITDDLPLLLDIDVVAVGYEPSDSPLTWLVSPEIQNLGDGLVDAFLGEGGEAKLFRDITDDGTIFGAAAGLIRSAAVARLRPGRRTPVGLMALGARTNIFQPGQGTELVVFLARVLENCVDRMQDPFA